MRGLYLAGLISLSCSPCRSLLQESYLIQLESRHAGCLSDREESWIDRRVNLDRFVDYNRARDDLSVETLLRREGKRNAINFPEIAKCANNVAISSIATAKRCLKNFPVLLSKARIVVAPLYPTFKNSTSILTDFAVTSCKCDEIRCVPSLKDCDRVPVEVSLKC